MTDILIALTYPLQLLGYIGIILGIVFLAVAGGRS